MKACLAPVLALALAMLFASTISQVSFGEATTTPSASPSPDATPSPSASPTADAWATAVDEYFKGWFAAHPTQMTSAGFHERDGQLEDFSAEAIKKKIRWLRDQDKRIQAISPHGLGLDAAVDREMLLNSIQANLLELETVKSWQKNPDRYGSQVSYPIFVLANRKFASVGERLASVVSREKQIPKVFAEARKNLKNPPKIYTELALEQLPGTIEFFKKDVPAAFKDAKESPQGSVKKLWAEFTKTNNAVIAGLKSYQTYLKKTVLPRSKGDFRLGADTYAKKLKYEEAIDLPLDQLLKIGMENLRENQELFKRVSAMIDPNRTPRAILEELVHDHPKADGILDAFRVRTAEAKTFIQAHHIATIPSPVDPIIQETPAFERALFFASLDAPGPFETVAKEAFFNVTLPEPDWSAEKVEEHLQGYNRGTIVSTAIHEAYPGHYLQFLWLPLVKSKVRKLLGASSNIEGWAHYTEHMMLTQGLGENDPKLKLGQLQDALLRNARFIVGIQMHIGKMTYPEAIDYFVNEGYQSRTNGEREARRGTADPTYLYYTAGKLEILKLRDDFRKLKGPEYSLQAFHDEFLRQGPLPIALMRKAFNVEGSLF